MRAVFNFQRTGIFWWGLITALVFMIPEFWMNGVAGFLRGIDIAPFDIIQPIGKEIDGATEALLGLVRFDRTQALVFIGPYGIANLLVGIVLAVLLLVIAVVLYFHAAKNRGVFDDFVAMAFLYVVLRVVGVASKNLNISVIDYFHSREPVSYLIVITVFMAILLLRGQGLNDSKVFFKLLFEAIIVWTLVQPRLTLQSLAWVVERPALLHQILTENAVIKGFYPMVVAIWAMIGLGIVAINLYGSGKTPAPVGGGSGSEAKGSG